jgi:8-oxo-dGTP pyrophosphatase MutT (NUDIX family)
MVETEPSRAMPAATVVLVRPGSAGLETLMLRRSSRGAFGGMWVFPGGRVDPEDFAGLEAADALGAARCAAVREALEEAGLEIDPAGLSPFAHWTPPSSAPAVFPTWFFIAPAPAGSVAIDGDEIHDHAWMHPSEALRRRDAGEIELAPPTWVTLHRLSAFADPGAAVARLGASEPRIYVTRIVKLEDGMASLWAGDAGYADGDFARPGPRHRLCMRKAGWRYEDTVHRW